MGLHISNDPREFKWDETEETILNITKTLIEGRKTEADKFCKCSFFPLIDKTRMAIKGDLFAGVTGVFPELVAQKMTMDLWQEIVRIYKQNNK